MTQQHYYTDQELAGLLGIGVGRLRNKISAGHSLPPRIEPPGMKNRLWPVEKVHSWLEQHMVTEEEGTVPAEPRKTGRPAKKARRR